MLQKSRYSCTICKTEIIPLTLKDLSHQLTESINRNISSTTGSPMEMRTPGKKRSPEAPLLESGSPPRQPSSSVSNSITYHLLQQLKHTLTDSLRNKAVYYHMAETTPLYYCQSCGTKLNANYVYYGLDMAKKIEKMLPEESFHTPKAGSRGEGSFNDDDVRILVMDPFSPDDELARGDSVRQTLHFGGQTSPRRPTASHLAQGGIHLRSSPSRRAAAAASLRSPGSVRSPDSLNSSASSDMAIIDLNTYGETSDTSEQLLEDTINQRAFHRYNPTDDKKNKTMHNMLLMLSSTYRRLQRQAEEYHTDIRGQVGAGLGWKNLRDWLSTFGIRTYPHLQNIVSEVKKNVADLVENVPKNEDPKFSERYPEEKFPSKQKKFCPELREHCPALWSMQHITPRGVELAMMDVDTSWTSYLVPTQRTRFIIVLLIIILFILMMVKPEWFKSRAPQSSGADQHSTTATTTTQTRPAPHPNPPPSPPAPAPHPNPPPSPPAPAPHPNPPPPSPASVNCNISSTCETSTHWEMFNDIMKHNAALEQPVVTLTDLFSICGSAIQTVFTTIFSNCTGQNPEVWRMLSNPSTTNCTTFGAYLKDNFVP